MKTYRHWYNAEGKEVPTPEEASKCHEIITDDKGCVVKEAWYVAEEEREEM